MTFVVRHLGLQEYLPTWQRMRDFVAARSSAAADELWIVEHPPVFTQGLAGKTHHILDAGDIPVIATDRGGQVTYHGPGQLVVYTLLDLKHHGLGPRELVRRLEAAIIGVLARYHIDGMRRAGAPGVYVAGAKIAALGLRIRNHYTYHGLALNVAMDLAPFARINPCGYAGLAVTSLEKLGVDTTLDEVAARLVTELEAIFAVTTVQHASAADNGKVHPEN